MDLIESINLVSSPLSLLALLILTGFAAFKVYLDFRKSIARTQVEYEKRIPSEISSAGVDNLSNLLVQNFKVLNTYYSENLSQSRTSTLASISISVIGFLVIIAGVMIAFIGKEAVLGSVSSAAGSFLRQRPSCSSSRTKNFRHRCRSRYENWCQLNI